MIFIVYLYVDLRPRLRLQDTPSPNF